VPSPSEELLIGSAVCARTRPYASSFTNSALVSVFLCSEVRKFREVQGRVFRCYLKPTLYSLNFLVPLNLYAVHYVSIAPRVAREKDGSASLCVERRKNEIRVRVERLRGSPTSHRLDSRDGISRIENRTGSQILHRFEQMLTAIARPSMHCAPRSPEFMLWTHLR
jgi:hypothetical protein